MKLVYSVCSQLECWHQLFVYLLVSRRNLAPSYFQRAKFNPVQFFCVAEKSFIALVTHVIDDAADYLLWGKLVFCYLVFHP